MSASAALDRDRLASDLSRLVQARSLTGDERPAFECLAAICAEHGLRAEVHEHDLAALRRAPGYPGEEAPRTELLSLTATRGRGDGPRLCLCGHVDVVEPGSVPWQHGGPWSGEIAAGAVHGRGSVDMKAGVVAALHAIAAAEDPSCEVALLAVSSEEDGGLGAFAALERDASYDACLIPEPTDFQLVCAHAGALTFRGVVTGVAAHAAYRLAGTSAIDRYVPIHLALAELERTMNTGVEHPLMRAVELPYPLLVGRVAAGEWSSSVPDRLEFEGRVGVPVGSSPAEVRARFEATVPDAEISWLGGQFGSGSTPVDHPFTELAASALGAELGAPPERVGVPYGADMRLFTARGIPTLMFGPPSVRLAHAVDEHVAVDDVLLVARALVRVVAGFA